MENVLNDIFMNNFNEFAKSSYLKLSSDPDFKMEEQLYHYTSLENLQKIIEDGSFQASSIYMMNDPNELIHGYNQVSRWYLGEINNRIGSKERYRTIYGFPAFVFCLTEQTDDMYSWDKYGDHHKGIRIGFTPESLIEYWKHIDNATVILVPVIYQKYDNTFIGKYSEEFQDFRKKLVREINGYYSKNGFTDEDESNLAYYSALISSLIKREEWSIEKEWRIICITSGYVDELINGFFKNGEPFVKLVNTSEETLKMLTNKGHSGGASKDILKIGSLAGNVEYINYVITLLFRKKTKCNYFNDVVTQSMIQTR